MLRRAAPTGQANGADLIAAGDKMGGESYQLAPSVEVLPKAVNPTSAASGELRE